MQLRCDGVEPGWMAVYLQGIPRSSSLLFKPSPGSNAVVFCGFAPECSYRQRRIRGRRPALARNVADVHANPAVGEREMIQVIATDEGGRLKFVGDRNTADTQRLSRQHAALNCPELRPVPPLLAFQGNANQVLATPLAGHPPEGRMYREKGGGSRDTAGLRFAAGNCNSVLLFYIRNGWGRLSGDRRAYTISACAPLPFFLL